MNTSQSRLVREALEALADTHRADRDGARRLAAEVHHHAEAT